MGTVVLGTPVNSDSFLQFLQKYQWNFCNGSYCITAEWPQASCLSSLLAHWPASALNEMTCVKCFVMVKSAPVLSLAVRWVVGFIDLPSSLWGSPGVSDGKESACNVGDPGSIPGLERSPRGGNGHPLQYSCLENPVDREAWWATVHGVTNSRTRLKQLSTHTTLKTLLFRIYSLCEYNIYFEYLEFLEFSLSN